MTLGEMGLIGMGVYLVALFVLAEAARRARRDLTPSDHFLAGRQLGVFVLFLTLYATTYSGNSLLGYPAEAYRRGFSWIMATGFMLAIVFVFHALVPRLRPIALREGFVTPGDWVRYRFGEEGAARPLRVAVAVLMAIALCNFLLGQLMAMGHVASQVTGGLVPYSVGVVALAAVVLFYETLGGMRAVAWTDAAQGIMMLVGLMTLLGWLVGEAGGVSAMTGQIALQRPEAIRVPPAEETANWISTLVLLGLASVVYPQAIQRIYAARSARALKRALALMTFMPLATTLVVTLIGLAAIPRFHALGAIEAETIMPRLLESWAAAGSLTTLLAMLVFLGALAAIMSTADSVLLSLGSILSEDLLGGSRLDPATTRVGKRIAAGLMLAMVVIAIVPRITLWHLIELKMELLIQCAPAFLIAIHWPRMRADATLWGLLAGTVVAVVAVLLGFTRIGGFHVGVLSLLLNLALALLGSLRAAPRAALGRLAP